MGKVTKELNSKQHTYGNLDRWFYNISSPRKLHSQGVIRLNLWDTMNESLVKKSVLVLKDKWLSRIKQATTHFNLTTEICKVHIQRRHGTNKFIIYFGRKGDGIYKLP